jgi:cullin 3
MSQEQAMQHWQTIKEAIHKIYAKQASSLSYEELYRTAYNLVLHKHGELLYNGVKNTTIELLQPIVEQLINASEEDLLKRLNDIWQQEKLCIIMIKDILMYMDRNYVPKLKLQSVEHLQTSQFKNHVILNHAIKQKVITKLISEIKKERDGGIVEITQMRSAIQMLVEVGISSKKIYENEFEKIFIHESQNYYRMESNQFITDNSCYSYLQKAKQRLNEELDRLLNYLDSSSEKILIKTFL